VKKQQQQHPYEASFDEMSFQQRAEAYISTLPTSVAHYRFYTPLYPQTNSPYTC
jgi:hypothetical protein